MTNIYPSWLPDIPDFSGWATRNDMLCSDGVVIREDAFSDQHMKKVPLVWQHKHGDPITVLGHAFLENRPEGVYAYGFCNSTDAGQHAKEVVRHGDVSNFSIFANKLTKAGSNILHGVINEVSLVLAGANPGAVIDVPYIEHVYDGDVNMAYIYHDDDELKIYHSDKGDKMSKKTIGDVVESMTDDQKDVLEFMIDMAQHGEPDDYKIEHGDIDDEDYIFVDDADADEDDDDDYVFVDEDGNIVEDYDDIDDEDDEDYILVDEDGNEYDMEDDEVKHNVFNGYEDSSDYICHVDVSAMVEDAKRNSTSLSAMVEDYLGDSDIIMHAENEDHTQQTYGMTNVNYLFPDAKTLNNTPEFIRRDTGWVSKLMGGVYRSPFSRIKSIFANITEDEARAKGYLKGKQKKEEVFTLLKRITQPQTVYKKQKIDRDDTIDITSFDVISWIKMEMRLMLDEELARAILIGDGRQSDAEDKIKEDMIRPIAKDASLYNIKVEVKTKSTETSDDKAQKFIESVIRARKDYKGSGSPTMFISEDMLADLLLLKDKMGRFIYSSEQALATTLRVKEIVTVPVLEEAKIEQANIIAVIVNPFDYAVGADKGGEVNLFDDFDIDYNQMKYLIETRCSGALRKPYASITVTHQVEG